MNNIDTKAILDCPMDPARNDAGVKTVRDYLVALLTRLWREEEGFSGKRPFGNSGWQREVYAPLIQHGHIAGVLDEYGYPATYNSDDADKLIIQAIAALGAS